MELTILVYGLIAACAELLGGGMLAMRTQWPKRAQHYLLALSAGFLLALVFLELIPESLRAIGAEAPLCVLLGYAVLHFFEHTLVSHLHFGEETHHEVMISKLSSLSTFGGLSVHAFFDGFAISVGMQYNYRIGMLIFLGVLLHKIPEGLTIASVMLAAEHRRQTAFLASAAVAAATLLGAISVFFLGDISPRVVGLSLAFAAGITTYVGASDLIPEINHAKNRLLPVFVFVGMILFYLGSRVLEPLAGPAH